MTWMLAILVLLLGCGEKPKHKRKTETEAPDAERQAAVAEIERLGGTVEVDETRPEKPVISVDLNRTKVTDAGLENLKGLTKRKELDLRFTKVTDTGLVHLKGLTEL